MDGTQVGVVPLDDALRRAQAKGLDLVQMAEGEIIVCKLMDYGRHQFKRKKVSRRGQRRMQIKEIKLRPHIGAHDYSIKLRQMVKFLEDGDKVKVTVRFKGREIVHPHFGVEIQERLAADVADLASIEQMPVVEGRQVVMVLMPTRKGRSAAKAKSEEARDSGAKHE